MAGAALSVISAISAGNKNTIFSGRLNENVPNVGIKCSQHGNKLLGGEIILRFCKDLTVSRENALYKGVSRFSDLT